MLSTAIDSNVASDVAPHLAEEPAESGAAPRPDELLVTICSPSTHWRDSLSEFIDQCLETELQANGAPARSIGVSKNLEDSLAHHLERCLALGFDGIRLRLSSLGLIAEAGVLSAKDSNTLRWWLDAQGRLPLSVEVSPDVERLRVYLAPVSISTLLWARHGNGISSTIEHSLSETPLMPLAFDRHDEDDPAADSFEVPFTSEQLDEAAQETPFTDIPDEDWGPHHSLRPELPPPALQLGDLVLQPEDEPEPTAPSAAAVLGATSNDGQLGLEFPAPNLFAPDSDVTPAPAELARSSNSRFEATPKTPTPPSAVPASSSRERCALVDALVPATREPNETDTATPAPVRGVTASDASEDSPLRTALTSDDEAEEKAHLRVWRDNLDQAGGAQSWEDLERLFLANYLPLLHAVEAGQASRGAAETVENWAANFEDCYSEAFAKLRCGGHRPTMLCDVPNLAFNLARELDAPKTRLVLVDGMRFDLGQRAHDKLRLQLTGVAQCVARGVLWSALPATTGIQLELLARGPTALRNLSTDLDESAWVAKGAAARRLRPMRVGGLNMTKLDILEAEFHDIAWSREVLDRGAAEVATSVGRYIRQQASGTLVVVFSDHGSRGVDDDPEDASPERVLVPYDAWLVGLDA